jgi:hypothetical protein
MVPVRAVDRGVPGRRGYGTRCAEIAFRLEPIVAAGLDGAVSAESAEDRRSVAGADFEDACGAVDREGGVLAEGRVEPAGEVSKAGTGEQVVPLVGEFALEESDELGAMREQFSRWLWA